jgi:formylglycine-generating enzyme required for sulfatase activity
MRKIIPGYLLPLMLVVAAAAGAPVRTARAPEGMVLVPAGSYRPFIQASAGEAVHLRSFYLDVHAVTNAEFLAFVKANPSWARSKVSRLYADENYLRDWQADDLPGPGVLADAPVTGVSWFAAQAYCRWKGKRLPTMDEWEYAAGARPVGAGGKRKLSEIILDWYSRPNPPVLPPVGSTFKNAFGLYDMHGLIWEWVYDFNSVVSGGGLSGSSGGHNFFCAAGSLGAADKEDYAAFMRYAFRGSLRASSCVANLGFRCAMDAGAGAKP